VLREKACNRCGQATLIAKLPNGRDVALDARAPVYFEAYSNSQGASGVKPMPNAYVPHHCVCPRARGLNREWSEPERSTEQHEPTESAHRERA
jgi:hypothetical protein